MDFLPEAAFAYGHIILPPRFQSVAQGIRDCISLYENKCSGAKPGVLMEGPSGTGKSSLVRAVLERKGYVDGALFPNATKKFQVISTCNKDTLNLIKEACSAGLRYRFDRRRIKFLTDLRVKNLLLNLLTGVDEHGNKLAHVPLVFATQNGGEMTGVNSTAAAAINRFQLCISGPYQREDLLTIAEYLQVPDAACAVDVFLKGVKSQHVSNMRYFLDFVGDVKLQCGVGAVVGGMFGGGIAGAIEVHPQPAAATFSRQREKGFLFELITSLRRPPLPLAGEGAGRGVRVDFNSNFILKLQSLDRRSLAERG